MKSKTNRASMYPPSKAELIQSSINNRQSTIVNIQSSAGFTLIEIGIAIFILAVGLISMLTLFPVGVDSMKKVTQYSNAAVLSESAISELIANKDYILGTMTAGISYAHPDNNVSTTTQFKDSSDPPNIIFPQYSWQAILKSISATDNNLVRAQIAIFRNFNYSQFGTGTATFAQQADKTTVENVSAFPSWLTSKHYIRADNDKFWYRINSIDTPGNIITLEGPFLGTTGTGLAFSTTDDIIDVYETMFSKR